MKTFFSSYELEKCLREGRSLHFASKNKINNKIITTRKLENPE
jgi:hypothetical protein